MEKVTRRKVIYSISSEMNETSKKKMLRCSSLQQHGNVHFIIQCSVCAAFVTCWERDALIVQPGVPRGTWGFLRGQLRAPAPTLWMNPPEIELKHVRAAAHPTLLMCRSLQAFNSHCAVISYCQFFFVCYLHDTLGMRALQLETWVLHSSSAARISHSVQICVTV